MEKNKTLIIIFLIIGNLFSCKNKTSLSELKLINKSAPKLSEIIVNIDDGPHKKFINAESCLKCHRFGATIEGLGKAPIIPHKPQLLCVSCHELVY